MTFGAGSGRPLAVDLDDGVRTAILNRNGNILA